MVDLSLKVDLIFLDSLPDYLSLPVLLQSFYYFKRISSKLNCAIHGNYFVLAKESLKFGSLGNISIKINSYEELIMYRHHAKRGSSFILINI